MTNQAEVAARVRAVLGVDATDEEILELSKGSLLRAQVELNVACEDFGRQIAAAFRPLSDWLRTRMPR